MKYLHKYDNIQYDLILDRLHINTDLDIYSDEIYDIIKSSDKNKFIFKDKLSNINITELIIKIADIKSNGYLDVNSCKELHNGWKIVIYLSKDFKLHTLKHELSHALRLTLYGKDKVIKNLNYIKSIGRFKYLNNKEIDNFFYILYIANEEEINASIAETVGHIKELIKANNIYLTKDEFIYIIKTSDAYQKSELLINFSFSKNLKSLNKKEINKLLYIIEEEKEDLYKKRKSKFKLILNAIKNILFNKIDFDEEVYPIKGYKFYEKMINNKGHKLRKNLYSLYDLFI